MTVGQVQCHALSCASQHHAAHTAVCKLQGTRVDERLYSAFDETGQPIRHTQFVQRLDSLPPGQVRRRV